MSDRLAGKIKENAGKTKYSTLNLNQTYKGTKVETKTNTGAARHGLQSLGKIGSSRRIPPPANLPSLKSENSGNDPTVSLVPSGGGGWGTAKEKTETSQPATTTVPAPPPSSTTAPVNAPAQQQPLLQPQRPTPPSSYPTQPPSRHPTQTQSAITGPSHPDKNESQGKTWGSVSSNEAGGQGRPYSHQPSPYFNREFPSLGGGNGGDGKPDGKEGLHGPPPVVRNTHEPPWMDRSGPGPPPDYGVGRDHEMYNGRPGPGGYYRRPPHDYQFNRNYPPNQYNGNYQGGRPPPHGYGDPNGRPPVPRQGPGSRLPPRPADMKPDGEREESKPRPALLRPEDIQAMDDDDDDGGWATAHGEVDYTAKLNFEDPDDTDKEDSTKKENRERQEESDRDRPEGKPANEKRDVSGPYHQHPPRHGQDGGHPSQQPRSAWGDPPSHPSFDREGQRGASMGHPIPPQTRPFDNRAPPPTQGYGPSGPSPWNMQHPPQHRAPPGQYPPLGASPPMQHGRGPVTGRGEFAGPPSPNEERQKEWAEQQRIKEERHAAIERARKRREEEELKLQAERKAAAMAKLEALDKKRKAREEEGKADKLQDDEDATMAEKHNSEIRQSEMREQELFREREEREQREQRDWEERNRESSSFPSDQRPSAPRHDGPLRTRNDSDSSDASRSSGSRYFNRTIPPRFQQQRQQQHQQYQQQQQYQASRPQAQHKQQQVPQSRDYSDAPPQAARPKPIPDAGPASPTHPVPLGRTGESAPPVTRIMKRSESSSTAGDDVASIMSLESVGEKEKDREQQQARIQDDSRAEIKTEDKREPSDNRKPKRDGVIEDSENRDRRSYRPDKDNRKERPRNDKLEDYRDDRQRRDRKEQKGEFKGRDRQDERDVTSKQESESRKSEVQKRKIDESEDYVEEHRHKITSRDRESQPESQSRRGGFPVRGRGRGAGLRGRSDFKASSRDSRLRTKRDIRSPLRETTKSDDLSEESIAVKAESEPQEKIEDRAPKEAWKDRSDKGGDRLQEKPSQRKDERYQSDKGRQDRERPERDRRDRQEKERPYKQSGRGERNDRRGERYQDRREQREREEDREPRDGKGRQRQPSDSRKPNAWNKENRGSKEDISKKLTPREKDSESKERSCDQRRTRDGDRYQGRDRDGERDQEQDRETQEESLREPEQEVGNIKGKDQDTVAERDRERNRAPRGTGRTGRDGTQRTSTRDSKVRNPFPTRGKGGYSARGARRGGVAHRGKFIGSGRLQSGGTYRPQPKYEDVSEDEGSQSDSSSYTTATSASEERSGDELDGGKKQGAERSTERPRSANRIGRGVRGASGGRALRSPAGRGFGRQRREQEKPPRFQKQQERAAAQQRGLGRGRSRGIGRDTRDSSWSRGRGRGRGRGSYIPNSEAPENEVGLQESEDWEEELSSTPKPKPKDDKTDVPRKDNRKGGFGSRSTSDGRHAGQKCPRDDSSRSGPRRDNQRNTQKKGDHFLAEKQQVTADGSKASTTEPKGALPAAKTGDASTSKLAGGQNRQEMKGNEFIAVDSIGSDAAKASKRPDQAVKKADIKQYDLHNVAGVICIDDFTDDDSDISSTLSGFVQVTSKRAQKELKEKQREEEEKKRRTEEKAAQRGDAKFKKNQPGKAPRFTKQHQSTSPTPTSQPKQAAGKIPVGVDTAIVPPGSVGSNASSTSSTKRNSPITVERPLSPPPPPVFNAWNKPLTLVTPAKAPSAAMVLPANVPDPLAVGSGKPSSRQTHSSVMASMQNSLMESSFEDKSAEDELKEMTKEIESMAPTEEHEDTTQHHDHHKHRGKNAKDSESKGTSKHKDGDKKQQPKPQRERPPRFERGKRKAPADEESKKGSVENNTDSASSNTASQENKVAALTEPAEGKATATSQIKGDPDTESTLEDTTNDEKKDDTIETKNDAQPRKGSDYSTDSGERSNEDGIFNSGSLSVDIPETNAERPPSPVSPTMYEMNRKMFAARKAWEDVQAPSVSLSVSMPSPSTWDDAIRSKTSSSVSSSRVGVTSVESESGSRMVNASSSPEGRPMSDSGASNAEVPKSESQVANKKPGAPEQQNVCKVKPQQQQPPLSTAMTAPSEERTQQAEPVVLSQPIITPEHMLQQSIHPYQYQLDAHLVQPYQRQAPQYLQQHLQPAQQVTNTYQMATQMPQVRQPTSAPSPLSQQTPELFQSPFLNSNLYSASSFQGSQSFMSIPLVPTTATQSYVATRTQAPSVLTLQGQPKSATGSMFAPSHAQTVYMPFDPQSALFGYSQASQPAQRAQMMTTQQQMDALGQQQAHLQSAQQQQQQQQQSQGMQFQRPIGFQPTSSQANANVQKPGDDRNADYNRSQSDTSMIKHINAKPFEPPKRLSTPTSSMPISTSSGGMNTYQSSINMVPVRPSPPHVDGFSQSPPMSTLNMSNRPVSMSPVDPNLPFTTAIGSFTKPAPIGHFQMPPQQQQPVIQQFTPFQQQQVHIKPHQLQHQLQVRPQTQQPTSPQQQHGMTHIQTSANQPVMHAVHRPFGPVGGQMNAGHAAMVNPRFPGPIQRPPAAIGAPTMAQVMTQGQPRPIQPPRLSRAPSVRMANTKAPMISTRPQVPATNQVAMFQALQRQKMLEQTRDFFNQEKGKPPSIGKQQPLQQLQEKQLQDQLQMQHMQKQTTQQLMQGPMMHLAGKQQQPPAQLPQQQPTQVKKQQPLPIAPSAGAHHQNKPPRLQAQENKSKQQSQVKQEGKKEENKSHIIELPRKKTSDNANKSKPSKSGDDNQNSAKTNGKGAPAKRGGGGGGMIRIAPLPRSNGRGRPNKGRPPSKPAGTGSSSAKPKDTPSVTTAATSGATTTTSKPGKEAASSSKGPAAAAQDTSSVKKPDPVKAPDPVSVN